MRGPDWKDEAMAERRSRVQSSAALAALDMLVAYGTGARHLEVAPGAQGKVKDIRFLLASGNGWPFVVIPNRKELVFHVRPLGVRTLRITRKELQGQFAAVEEVAGGKQLRIRLRMEGEAQQVIDQLLHKWPGSAVPVDWDVRALRENRSRRPCPLPHRHLLAPRPAPCRAPAGPSAMS